MYFVSKKQCVTASRYVPNNLPNWMCMQACMLMEANLHAFVYMYNYVNYINL